ncbi:hypothetical protein ACGFIJ_29950 [Microbispora bryophytorum]|uniref:hypothetical protein n=1 Tax=Microbispora bryophytorum TaxID=1460882 RepID=UPI0037243853
MVNLAAVISHFPRLRALAYGPIPPPREPEETAYLCFIKAGPASERMVHVIVANAHRALETTSVGGGVVEETTTPLGRQQLAVWYAQRCTELLADGWHPSFVSPPAQVPSTP